jgi:hypothetical protein
MADKILSPSSAEQMQQLVALLRPIIGLDNGDDLPALTPQILGFAKNRHRLAPLLSYHLRTTEISAPMMEAQTRDALKAIYRQNAVQETIQKRVWDRIAKLFADNDLAFWGLKGQGLAESIYPFTGGRVSKDIDILIHPQDIDTAMQLLVQDGFTIAQQRITSSSDIAHFKNGLSKDAMFYDPQFGQQIELHRRLLYAEPKGLTALVRNETPSGQFVTISGVAGMLYTIIHGALDYWSRLKWLVDLSLLCRHIDSERLERLLQLADRFSCRTALIASLYYCEHIFAGSLQAEVKARVDILAAKDKGLNPLIDRFANMLQGHHDYSQRSLWRRPDFPTPAWHIFPSTPMRAWLCGYVPLTFIARKVAP